MTTDIHIIAKNLNHNERIALFEYIRITKDNVKKETIEEIEKMINNEEVTSEEEYIIKKIILQRIYDLKEKSK